MALFTSLLAVAAPLLLAMSVDALIVGLALSAVRTRLGGPLGSWSTAVVLMVTFAVLDVGWVLLATPLNISCSIGNATIASATGLTEPFWLNETLPLGWFEIVIWSAQTFVAAMIASWIAPDREPSAESP